jgi:ferritin-like metal-binding protein YciE
MNLNSLQELYVEQLKDLYDAEHQIIKALPEMIEAASSKDLKDALTEHLDVTKTHATRLETLFTQLGETGKGEKCKGMKGVLEEGSDLVDDVKNPDVRDAAIIASAQRVEHYEIVGYGTARTFAELLGQAGASQLLQQTLDEEKQADEKLTVLAEEINVSASGRLAAAENIETEKTAAKERKTAA